MSGADYGALLEAVKTNQYFRSGSAMKRASQLPEQEAAKLLKQFAASEEKLGWSIDSITPLSLMGEETRPPLPRPEMGLRQLLQPRSVTGDAALDLKRKPDPKGEMEVFGYENFSEHAKALREGN